MNGALGGLGEINGEEGAGVGPTVGHVVTRSLLRPRVKTREGAAVCGRDFCTIRGPASEGARGGGEGGGERGEGFRAEQGLQV